MKYRGVFVGRVDHIGVAPDSKLIKVVLKIESGQTLDSNIVAQNLEKASENLNQIMDILADQPSQLLFGEPPGPRNVEADIYSR